jgi:hypothetical protein
MGMLPRASEQPASQEPIHQCAVKRWLLQGATRACGAVNGYALGMQWQGYKEVIKAQSKMASPLAPGPCSCTMSRGRGEPVLSARLPVHSCWSVLLILPLRHVVVVLHEDLQVQQDPVSSHAYLLP